MQDIHICEIFSSVQGEGLLVGIPAVFIRFAGCNLSCSYCDTEYARSRSDRAAVYSGPVRTELRNPIPVDDIAAVVLEEFGPVETVILTGGEPLIQAGGVSGLAGRLRMLGCGILLETNGTLPAAFAESKNYIDHVCMDIKLPSTQGGVWFEREHLEFLRLLQGKDAAVKMVLTQDVGRDEFTACVDLIGGVNSHIPVLLQPAFRGRTPLIGGERLIELQRIALSGLSDVRISVQLHKLLGIR